MLGGYGYAAYKQGLGALSRVSPLLAERISFRERVGYWPRLKAPRSFNEKVLWTKVHQRDPLRQEVADKLDVRGYVDKRLGSDEILVPCLHSTSDPETIPFEELPDAYILKATHGSGWSRIVREDEDPDREDLVAQCRAWLSSRYGGEKLEWAYQGLRPRIVVEPLLTDEAGTIPRDFKLFAFNGSVELIQVDTGRYREHKRTLYSPSWDLLPVTLEFPQGPHIERPSRLDEMVDIAERLSEPFDFIRVDLYHLEGEIYFGELTNYPGSGKEPFSPQRFDFELGRRWDLDGPTPPESGPSARNQPLAKT